MIISMMKGNYFCSLKLKLRAFVFLGASDRTMVRLKDIFDKMSSRLKNIASLASLF
jgi:hypothetical protein